MPVHSRGASSWDQGVLYHRGASSWSGSQDAGFVYDQGEWKAFQPSGTGSLLPVENLASSSVTDTSGTITWTQPTHTVEPDHTQYRIPELTPVWTEVSATTLTATFTALDPSTSYQAQVRNITRDDTDGSLEFTSEIKSIYFTTDAANVSNPANDPGGSGPDSLISFQPNTSGSCHWDWKVQTPDYSILDAVVWNDTAVSGSEPSYASVTNVNVDWVAAGLACGGLARIAIREDCGTPGDWEYGQAFILPCDWAVRCAGTTVGTAWSMAPFDDAIAQIPQPCMEDAAMQVECYATEITYGQLSGYQDVGLYEGNWFVSSKAGAAAYGEPIIAGRCTAYDNIAGGTDSSFTFDIYVTDQPQSDLLGGTLVARFGNRVTFRIYSTGSGFKVGAVFAKDGGGAFSLQSSTELSLDGWHTVTLSIDNDGDKILYINGTANVTDSDTTAPDFAGFTRDAGLFGNDQMFIKKCSSWDRALSAAEVGNILFTGYEGESFFASQGGLNPTVGDVILAVCIERGSGNWTLKTPGPPTDTGTATMGTWVSVSSLIGFDKFGTTQGAFELWASECSSAGTWQPSGSTAHMYVVIPASDIDTSGGVAGGFGTVSEQTADTGAAENTDLSLTPAAKSGTVSDIIYFTVTGYTTTPTGKDNLNFNSQLADAIDNTNGVDGGPDLAGAMWGSRTEYSTTTQTININSTSLDGTTLASVEIIES